MHVYLLEYSRFLSVWLRREGGGGKRAGGEQLSLHPILTQHAEKGKLSSLLILVFLAKALKIRLPKDKQ